MRKENGNCGSVRERDQQKTKMLGGRRGGRSETRKDRKRIIQVGIEELESSIKIFCTMI